MVPARHQTAFIVLLVFLLVLSVPGAMAGDRIALCRAGATDDVLFSGIRKYLTNKGYTPIVCDIPKTIEKQIESAGKMNKEKIVYVLAVELIPSDQPDAFVAISDAKKMKGLVFNADEVPGNHVERSEELASSIAARFGKKVKHLPLFMLLGIDAPGVFVRLHVPKEKPQEIFDKLYDGLSTYRERGSKDERELKGERRNSKPED
ncbi:MAG: hypothetical protein ACYDHW_11265 [Syntrophorhabdaceae bacterium]